MTDGADRRPRPRACPDPERIAARVEGRLEAAEAAHVDAHVASCSDCTEVLAETIRYTIEEEEVEPASERGARPGAGLLPFRRRPGFRAAAGLAAAAVLILAVGYVAWRSRPSTPAAFPLLADLAEAMGTERFVEPRLTGGFEHGRLVVLRSGERPRGLDAYPPAVLAAVARIRERAEAAPSPENLAALGVTYLVSGDVPAAVRTLESATEQAPDDPRLLSDLAAAYLVRANRLDEPADLPKALEAAEKAIEVEGAPAEAWFNRALALESLHLTDAARKAWQDYLDRDASSGWADEARQHLESLAAVKQSSLEEDHARVRAALDGGPAAIDRLAQTDPAILREYFESMLLPEWADAHLTGQPEARLLREQAQLVGDLVMKATGDALPRDTARALAGPPTATGRDPPRSQALGIRAFREAMKLADADEPSCSLFRDALRHLDEGGSAFATRSAERAVGACYYPINAASALPELRRIATVARDRDYLYVLGRTNHLQGLFFAHRGHWSRCLEQYELARAGFKRIGDREGEARIATLRAEALESLGERRQSWHERSAGLALFEHTRTPRAQHLVLAESSWACQRAGLIRSALPFETEVLTRARAWGNTLAIADSLVSRAKILGTLGSAQLAATDLAEARRLIPGIGAVTERGFVSALADEAEAQVLLARAPERAATAYRRALDHFGRASPSQTPRLRLLLARAQIASGLATEAEKQLEIAIEALERERLSLRDASLKVSSFDESVPLFDEMVRLQVDHTRDSARALSFVERGRARQLADSLTSPAASIEASHRVETLAMPFEPDAIQQKLPPGVGLVYYACLPDRLLAWVLTRDGVEFAGRPLPAERLRGQVAAYQAAIDLRAPLDVLHEHSARLYDELVRPVAPSSGALRTLILVRDGLLQSLSFASLWNRESGRYLIEDHVLGFAPSGTVFVRATAAATEPARRASPAALVVGNPHLDTDAWPGLPDLPGAEAEAVEIAGLYGGTALTGRDATKMAFAAQLAGSGVVHFAGHAVTDEAPWTARLLLASDGGRDGSGAMSLEELEGTSLPRTRLVVLGACRTASGAVSPLEGSLHMARPFLAAGVPTVIASLWDLDDAVSRAFLVAFHRSFRRTNDPLLALRETQVAHLQHSDRLVSHPASWAGFVGVGGMLGSPGDAGASTAPRP